MENRHNDDFSSFRHSRKQPPRSNPIGRRKADRSAADRKNRLRDHRAADPTRALRGYALEDLPPPGNADFWLAVLRRHPPRDVLPPAAPLLLDGNLFDDP